MSVYDKKSHPYHWSINIGTSATPDWRENIDLNVDDDDTGYKRIIKASTDISAEGDPADWQQVYQFDPVFPIRAYAADRWGTVVYDVDEADFLANESGGNFPVTRGASTDYGWNWLSTQRNRVDMGLNYQSYTGNNFYWLNQRVSCKIGIKFRESFSADFSGITQSSNHSRSNSGVISYTSGERMSTPWGDKNITYDTNSTLYYSGSRASGDYSIGNDQSLYKFFLKVRVDSEPTTSDGFRVAAFELMVYSNQNDGSATNTIQEFSLSNVVVS